MDGKHILGDDVDLTRAAELSQSSEREQVSDLACGLGQTRGAVHHLHKILLSCAVSILAFFAAAGPCSAGDLQPGETDPGAPSPVIYAIQPQQGGGDMMIVRVRGHEMPRPVVVSSASDSKLALVWSGVRFPVATDKRDWWDDYQWDVLTLGSDKQDSWWKQYDYPLLNRITATPEEGGGVRLTFTTTKPLVLSDVMGVDGADDLTLILQTREEPKPKQAVAPPKVYSKNDPLAIEKPVSLQIRDGDIKSVFRMLAEQQGVDLLIDPSVPDMNVTFAFKDIPYRDAFSYLLRAADLSYSMIGDMLVVGKVESLGKTLGKEIVRGYKISYAVDDNGDMRGDLTAALTGLVKLSTVPTLDNRTRTLYVTATPEQHEEVAELLLKLDQPGKQIMIQAHIIEVTDDGRQELEALVSAVYDKWLMNFSNSGASIGYNAANTAFEAVDLELPIAGRVPGSDATWGDIALDSGVNMLSAGLRALESKGKGKVLANPSVITLDGEEARVSLTQNYKYVSGVDANGNTVFSDSESGPRLSFTPVLGRNSIITVKVSIETGQIVQFLSAGNGAYAPETTSRKVDTSVRVRNGEPFAIGGLYQERKTRSRRRIPILGSIPLLGQLFSTRNDEHVKSEVAMIVIPYILDIPDEDISAFDLIGPSLRH